MCPGLEDVKTESSEARVPLPRPLLDVLRRHHARQAEDRLAAGPKWQEHGLAPQDWMRDWTRVFLGVLACGAGEHAIEPFPGHAA